MDLTLGLSPAALAIILCAFLVGGFLKGALGFGLPLLTMATVTLVAPVPVGLALNAVVTTILNVAQSAEGGRARPVIARFWPLHASLPAGVAVGAAFLATVDEAGLRLVLGLLVLAYVATTAFGLRLRIAPARERAAGVLTGLVGGVVAALTTANGPVLLMYLLGIDLDRTDFRVAIGQMFLASGLLAGAVFVALGLLDAERAALGLICLIPAAFGVWAGLRLGRRLDPRLFRAAVLAGLGAIGLNYTLRGLGAI